MLTGAHVSIAGGFDSCIKRGQKIGATAIQTFASSPRSYNFKPVTDKDLESYLNKRKKSDINLHVFHGIYLINLAHEKDEMRQKGLKSLINYQKLAGKADVLGTVFHLGSHKGKGFDAVLETVAQSIAQVLEQTPPDVWLLLENAAGHRGTLGQTIEELEKIIDAVEQTGNPIDQLGICLDTQHAFASGYQLKQADQVDQLVSDIDSKLGLDRLKVIHVNDSATEFNSHKDRHANINAGEIGEKGLANVVTHPKLKKLPFILEVPGKDKSGPRKVDVDQLKDLVNQ